MSPKNRPPDRWMDYTPMGEKISGTRFICMKVPLKPGLSQNMEENEKFSCETAMEMATAKGHKMGLVIDLSFTRRYYDPRIFEEKNVTHKKIFMPGRVIPEKDVIDSFTEAVKNFEEENTENEDIIAVHCTHGLNRTGYMICKYLIEKKQFKPEEAISAFEEARGHKIEREIYLNDLLGKPNASSPAKSDRFSSRGNGFINGYQNQRMFSQSAFGGPLSRQAYDDFCGGQNGYYNGYQDPRTFRGPGGFDSMGCDGSWRVRDPYMEYPNPAHYGSGHIPDRSHLPHRWNADFSKDNYPRHSFSDPYDKYLDVEYSPRRNRSHVPANQSFYQSSHRGRQNRRSPYSREYTHSQNAMPWNGHHY